MLVTFCGSITKKDEDTQRCNNLGVHSWFKDFFIRLQRSSFLGDPPTPPTPSPHKQYEDQEGVKAGVGIRAQLSSKFTEFVGCIHHCIMLFVNHFSLHIP